MNRLNKTIILSIFFVSAVSADMFPCHTAFAQSQEAKEFNRKGVVALESGRYNDSIQFLKQAMAAEPTWGEPCFNAARLLKLMNKREDMIKMLRKANGVEPNNAKYEEEYLKYLFEDYKKAEAASNNAEKERLQTEIFRVSPGNYQLSLSMAQEQLNLGNKSEALAKAEEAIAKNTKNRSNYSQGELGQLYYIVAQVAFEQGDLEKAKTNADYATRYTFAQKEDARALLRKIKGDLDDNVKGLVEQAQAAKKSGNLNKAMDLLKQAKEIQPENEEIENTIIDFENEAEANKLLDLARKSLADNRWLDARETLYTVLERFPMNENAKKMLDDLKPKEKALLNKIDLSDIPITSKDREKAVLNYKERGVKFFELGNFKDCVAPFNKALALIDEDKNLRTLRADIEGYLSKINKMDEDKNNLQKGKDAREAGEYEDVIKYLKLVPEDLDIQRDSFLAEAYYNTGDLEEAETYARKQLAKQPENNRAKYVLGSVKLDQGDNEAAHRYFTEIYNTDANYPGLGDKLAKSSQVYLPKIGIISALVILLWIAWVIYKRMPIYNKSSKINEGRKLFKQKFYDDAINVLLTVRHSQYLTPADTLEITKLFAQCYLKKGAYDKAVGECKHLIELSGKNEEAYTWLGYAYLGCRRVSSEALPVLVSLYKKDPRNIALVSLLGSYYAQQKVLTEDGVAVLEQWLNLDHDNVEVLKPLGKYYLKKSRSDDKAMKVFQKMMELGSPDPDFMLGVANVYLKTRQFDNCLQLCEQVINMDINNAYVHSILLEAYKKQNRLSELLDIYANFLQNNPYNVAFQNGLKAAQDAYNKIQSRNARQAANEAAAVMEKMMMGAQNVEEQSSEETSEQSYEQPSEQSYEQPSEEPQELAEGEIACPNCGKGNANGSYICQYCGANMV